VNETAFFNTRFSVHIVVIAAAIFIAALTGPFGTIVMPFASRLLFWGALIGWNALKWSVWNIQLPPRVPQNAWSQLAVAAAGAVLLNSTMAWEIEALYSAIGRPVDMPFFSVWLMAALISMAVSFVVLAAYANRAASENPQAENVALPLILQRSGVLDKDQLLAIEAEDHYVRLHLANGQKPMTLYRFGDALKELKSLDGLQVHRGAWIAQRGVDGSAREGRKWRLRLRTGEEIPISDSYLKSVRTRGWLNG
jgi:DNA-binding LytR/AlgR family response regulator